MMEELVGFSENVIAVSLAGVMLYVTPAPPSENGIEKMSGVL
jgi:hypothetical protein